MATYTISSCRPIIFMEWTIMKDMNDCWDDFHNNIRYFFTIIIITKSNQERITGEHLKILSHRKKDVNQFFKMYSFYSFSENK